MGLWQWQDETSPTGQLSNTFSVLQCVLVKVSLRCDNMDSSKLGQDDEDLLQVRRSAEDHQKICLHIYIDAVFITEFNLWTNGEKVQLPERPSAPGAGSKGLRQEESLREYREQSEKLYSIASRAKYTTQDV